MSNLLEKASIITTPTAYDNGKILSVKPSIVLGEELVTNGDFATDSDWTKGSNWTINNGVAIYTLSGFSNLSQPNLGLDVGKTYKLTVNLIGGSGSVCRFYFGGSSSTAYTLVNGLNVITGVAVSDKITFRNLQQSDFTIDNVSVKEVLDADFDFTRNSSATRVNSQGLIEDVQILSSNLVSNGDFSQEGSQLVTNGDFSQEGSEEITNGDFSNGSTDWELNPSSGTAIVSNGKLNFTNSTSQGTQVQQRDRSYVIGKTYKITFTVTDYIQGGVRLSLGNNLTTSVSANGTFTQYITYTSGLNRTYIYTNGSTLSIDNVSVKEVGQDWTLGTGWSIGTNKVIGDGTMGGNDVVRQIINFSQGTTYRFSFTVLDYISGGVFIRNPFNGYLDIASANGSYSFDYVAGINDYIDFRGNSFVGSITNVSVKEVGQDWTLGTGVTIGENKAIFTSTASGQSVSQNAVASSLTNGALAKVSFEVLSRTQGSFGVYFSGTLVGTLASAGVFTGYFTKGTETSFYIRALGTTSGSISNISVIEITDDTNLPRINYEGFSYQDALGSELVVNGDFSDGTNGWNAAGGGSISVSNNQLTLEGNNDFNFYARQTVLGYEVGKQYRIEIDVAGGSTSKMQVGIYGEGLFFDNQPIVLGKLSAIFTMTNGSNGGRFLDIINRNDDGLNDTLIINSVSVKEYLGQEVVPDSGCGSWLFEPQSTNEISYSEDFSNAYWSKLGSPTVTLNYGVSPSGQNNSVRIQGNSSTVIYNAGSFSATDGRSMYVKATSGSGNIQLLSHTSNTDNVFSIDENWKRVEINTAAGVGSIFYAVDMRGASTDIFDIEIWGAQIEQNSYATSYIPTNGSTVTRLQDAAFGAGSSDLINSTEGVLYAEIAALGTGNYKLISLNNGSPGNSVTIGFHQGTINFYFRVASSNGTTTYNTFPIDYDGFNKIALKYKSGDISIFANGTKKVQSSGTFAFASSLNKLNFDYGNGGLPFFGKTKCLAVFKEALTDEELECLTT